MHSLWPQIQRTLSLGLPFTVPDAHWATGSQGAVLGRAAVRSLSVLGLCRLKDLGYPAFAAEPPRASAATPGPADRAVALRTLARIHAELANKSLTVHESVLPPESALADSGLFADPAKNSTFSLRLEPSPWGSVALEAIVPEPVLEARRLHAAVDPDTVLKRFGWSNYASAAQRDAIRAILCAPQHAVILIVIPTGGGKSLCAHLPAFKWTDGGWLTGAMTVVVVPTIALALDQVRAASSRFAGGNDSVFALLGGTTEPRRTELFRDISEGKPSLVFISPEMALGRQGREALMKAARANRLASLVVDEAHLISSWGVKFRPDLQRLARFRQDLSAASPNMTTVLLSATVTPEGRHRLRSLYATDKDEFIEIDGASLRAEHDFAVVEAQNEHDRDNLTVQLLRRAPRPALVYTTRVDHADALSQRLRCEGFLRHGAFTGETPQKRRDEIIAAWRGDELDLVVGTSAFGLGIDKPDVRTVIHATLPESLDRYYQEVGRSGRDGFSALSVVIRCPGDQNLAADLLMSNLLKSETAAKRWVSMWHGSRHEVGDVPELETTTRLVDLDDRAAHVQVQAERSGRRNAEWNAATVLLLERARLLSVNRIDVQEDDRGHRWWSVGVKDPDLFNHEDALSTAIEQTRAKEQLENQASLVRLADALNANPTVCLLTHLAETYGMPDPGTCGRCQFCRRHGLQAQPPPPLLTLPASWTKRPARTRSFHASLQGACDRGYSRLVVVLSKDGGKALSGDPLLRAVCGLAEGGVDHFLLGRSEQEVVLEALLKSDAAKPSHGLVSALEDLNKGSLGRLPLVPTAVILSGAVPPGIRAQTIERLLAIPELSVVHFPLVFVLQEGLMDPVRPDRALAERIDGPRLRADALFGF
jgi:superfamily II DNA/RNA helicase